MSYLNHQSIDVDESTYSKAAAAASPMQVNAAAPLLLPSPTGNRRSRKKSATRSPEPLTNRAMDE